MVHVAEHLPIDVHGGKQIACAPLFEVFGIVNRPDGYFPVDRLELGAKPLWLALLNEDTVSQPSHLIPKGHSLLRHSTMVAPLLTGCYRLANVPAPAGPTAASANL